MSFELCGDILNNVNTQLIESFKIKLINCKTRPSFNISHSFLANFHQFGSLTLHIQLFQNTKKSCNCQMDCLRKFPTTCAVHIIHLNPFSGCHWHTKPRHHFLQHWCRTELNRHAYTFNGFVISYLYSVSLTKVFLFEMSLSVFYFSRT